MTPTETAKHNARLNALDETNRATVERELIRLGLANALEALEWLAKQAEEADCLTPVVSYGGRSEEMGPELNLDAQWWDASDDAHDLETRSVSAGAPKAAMMAIVRSMYFEYRKQKFVCVPSTPTTPAKSLLETARQAVAGMRQTATSDALTV